MRWFWHEGPGRGFNFGKGEAAEGDFEDSWSQCKTRQRGKQDIGDIQIY
jgi:hypothetical protein